jgi:hypothetical protein
MNNSDRINSSTKSYRYDPPLTVTGNRQAEATGFYINTIQQSDLKMDNYRIRHYIKPVFKYIPLSEFPAYPEGPMTVLQVVNCFTLSFISTFI